MKLSPETKSVVYPLRQWFSLKRVLSFILVAILLVGQQSVGYAQSQGEHKLLILLLGMPKSGHNVQNFRPVNDFRVLYFSKNQMSPGSFGEYFNEVSYDQMSVTGDSVGWALAPWPLDVPGGGDVAYVELNDAPGPQFGSGQENFTDSNNGVNGIGRFSGVVTPPPGINLNYPAEATDGDGFWTPGERFWDANGNGLWDVAERVSPDVDGDGVYDVNDGDGFVDVDGDGAWDQYTEPWEDYMIRWDNGAQRWIRVSNTYIVNNYPGGAAAQAALIARIGNGRYDPPEPFTNRDDSHMRRAGNPVVSNTTPQPTWYTSWWTTTFGTAAPAWNSTIYNYSRLITTGSTLSRPFRQGSTGGYSGGRNYINTSTISGIPTSFTDALYDSGAEFMDLASSIYHSSGDNKLGEVTSFRSSNIYGNDDTPGLGSGTGPIEPGGPPELSDMSRDGKNVLNLEVYTWQNGVQNVGNVAGHPTLLRDIDLDGLIDQGEAPEPGQENYMADATPGTMSNGLGSLYPYTQTRALEDMVEAIDGTVDWDRFIEGGNPGVLNVCLLHSDGSGEGGGLPPNFDPSEGGLGRRWQPVSPRGVGLTTVNGAFTFNFSATVAPGVGTMAHEWSHGWLGYPDLYDYDVFTPGAQVNNPVGAYDLMATGSMVHFIPPLKGGSQWVAPVDITTVLTPFAPTTIALPSVEFNPTGYYYYKNPNFTAGGGERYWFWNAQPQGFNTLLPANGMFILHTDFTSNPEAIPPLQTFESRFNYLIVQADGKADLDSGRNNGDAGDPFPGSQNVRSWGPDTNPSSRWYDQTDSDLQILDISDPYPGDPTGPRMDVTFLWTPRLVPTLSFTQPPGGLDKAGLYDIMYNAFDVFGTTTIDVYLDTDSSDYDGILIAGGIGKEAGWVSDQVTTNISGLADGDYFVYADLTPSTNSDGQSDRWYSPPRPCAENKGNGTVTVSNVDATASKLEIWTLTCVNGGAQTWDVYGAISGLQAGQATTGAAYTSDNNEVTFTINAGGTPFDTGDMMCFQTTGLTPYSGSFTVRDGSVVPATTDFTISGLIPARLTLIEAGSPPTPILDMNVTDITGANPAAITLDELTIQLNKEPGADPNDLNALGNTSSSGLQIIRDDGNIDGVYDSADTRVQGTWSPWVDLSGGAGTGPWQTIFTTSSAEPIPTDDIGPNQGSDYHVVAMSSFTIQFLDRLSFSMIPHEGLIFSSGPSGNPQVQTNILTANLPVVLTDLTLPGETIVADSPPTAVIDIDLADGVALGGPTLDSLDVLFASVGGDGDFTTGDMERLGIGAGSGVELYKDDGDGIFDPNVDAIVPLAAKPFWSYFKVTLAPALGQDIPQLLDGVPDYYVVIETRITIDDGDDFTVSIPVDGLRFSGGKSGKTVTTNVITAVNTPPWIDLPVPDPLTVNENTPFTYNLTPHENDVEDLGADLVWTVSGGDPALFSASVDPVSDDLTITPVIYATGSAVITLTLTDSDGATDTQDVTVDVVDVPPTVTLGADINPPDEGDLVTFTATPASTVGYGFTQYDWDFGDGATDTTAVPTTTHTYADDTGSPYTATVTVTDDSGSTGSGNLAMTINNVAPTVEAGNNQTIDEGISLSLTSPTFSDPGFTYAPAGTVETFTAQVDWGDGTIEAGSLTVTQGAEGVLTTGSVSNTHAYGDNGLFTVTVTVTDDDGDFGQDIFDVQVNNVDPVVNAGPDQVVDEGDTVSLAPATFTDAPGDTHTAQINWGDGTVEPGVVDEVAGTVSGSHVYADNGAYTVTVTVTDDDGGAGFDTFDVQVNNVAPVVAAGPDQTIDEGDTVSLPPATFTDAGAADTHTAQIDWGDGTVEPGVVDQAADTVSGSHVYPDDGTYTVTVTVTDDDGDSGFDAFDVQVNNVAPVVSAGPDQNVNEGDTVSLPPATFTDVGILDTHTAQIDWGDGAVEAAVVDDIARTVTGSHVYADDGLYTVTVALTDDDGGVGDDTFDVQVSNVDPVVDAGPDQNVNEGDTVSLAATFTDAGAADTHTAQIDWGDGSVEAGVVDDVAGTVSGSHVYADDGLYHVTVTVTDDDGGSDSRVFDVQVNNVNPVVDAGPDQTVNEGDTVSLATTFTDAGSADTHSALIDWDDGTVEPGVVDQAAGTVSGSHVYVEDGLYTVTVAVTDDDGGADNDTLDVQVNNADPVVDAGPDQSPNEGDTVSLPPATFTDAGILDTHTAEIDWGDGTVEPGTLDQAAGTVSGSHVYADDGLYTVTVTVTDDDGGAGNDAFDVQVNNVDPAVSAGPDRVVNEGETVSLPPATFTDAGLLDTHTAQIDWDDGAVTAGAVDDVAETVAGSHVYADDGTYTVTVTVSDDDGGSGADAFDVQVSNVDPVVDAGPSQNVNEGDTVSLATTFTDAGTADTHTAQIDWGDGTVTAGVVDDVAGTVAGNHVYADNGVYTVTVTVTDDNGGVDSGAFSVEVSNVDPVVDAGPDQTVNEGDPVSLATTFTDAGTGDTHTAQIDWGDGATEPGVVDEVAGTVSGSHVYADNNLYTVTVTVTDDDGGVGQDALSVQVNNAAPVVNAGADQTLDEGATLSLPPATFTDAGAGDTHTAQIDWGDGTAGPGVVDEAAATVSGSHVYADNGAYTVTVTVNDDDGDSGQGTFDVQVNNVAPVVNAGPDQTVDEGDTVALAPVTFTDAGAADAHTAEIDWGDGTVEAGALNQVAGTVSGSHVYADNGLYAVTVTVTDDDGDPGQDTFDVQVNNVAPVVNAGPDQVVDEGDTVPLPPATFTDAGTGDTHLDAIDWGDGAVTSGQVDQAADTVSGSHVYADDGTYTVTVTVTDDDGDSDQDSFDVQVNNVPPVVDAGPDQTADEGDTVALAPATFADAGAGDTHTAQTDWGDGTVTSGQVDQVADTVSGSHVYADSGAYTVIVTVTDDDGASAQDTFDVQVSNTAPVVHAGDDQVVEEGEALSLDPATFTDAGTGDTHTAQIDWGDGTIEAGQVDQAAGTVSGSHTYTDNGAYTVTVTVTDDNGGSDQDSFNVQVNNVAPVVNAGPDQTADEGDTVALAPAAFTDAGTGDTHLDAIDWGDGTVASGQVDQAAGTVSGGHVYADNGLYTVTVTVTDDDGDSDQDTFDVQVNNVAPVVSAGPDQAADEGDTVSLAPATFTDAGTGDTHLDAIDWGDGTVAPGQVDQAADTLSGSHVYADNGAYTVTVTVTDDDGDSGQDTFDVQVINVAPVVNAGPDQVVDEGDTVSLPPATFTDAGTGDTHIDAIDWGDGTVAAGQVDQTANTVSGSHAYADNGVYTVKVTVTDDDGLPGSDAFQVQVNNAPPVANAGGPYTGDEGSSITFSGSATDPGGTDVATYEWDLDYDGVTFNVDVSGLNLTNPSKTSPDDAIYTVALKVSDDDGGVSEISTAQVTVNNVPPTADAHGPYVANEGADITFVASVTDPGTDTFNYEWDFSYNGVTFNPHISGANFGTIQREAPDDAAYTVALRITDDDGGVSNIATTQVTVNNLPPQVDAGGPYTGDEGAPIAFAGQATDTVADGLTYEWDFEYDGATFAPDVTGTNLASPSHTYAEDGTYTVALRVSDDDGGVNMDTAQVTVNNLGPVANAGADQFVDEQSPVTLDGSASADPGGGPLTFLWAQTAGMPVTLSDATSMVPTFAAPNVAVPPMELLSFQLTVTDNQGLTAISTTNVRVAVVFEPSLLVDMFKLTFGGDPFSDKLQIGGILNAAPNDFNFGANPLLIEVNDGVNPPFNFPAWLQPVGNKGGKFGLKNNTTKIRLGLFSKGTSKGSFSISLVSALAQNVDLSLPIVVRLRNANFNQSATIRPLIDASGNGSFRMGRGGLTAPMLFIEKASLKIDVRPGNDRFSVKGYFPNAGANAPTQFQALTFDIAGFMAGPLPLTGKNGRFSFRAKGAGITSVKIDPASGEFNIKGSGVDLGSARVNPVEIRLGLDAFLGIATINMSQKAKGAEYK